MVETEALREAVFPTFIVIMVLAAILWALAFVRLMNGIRTIVDRRNGIRVSWLQIGWVAFAWAFVFAVFWPVLDLIVQAEWQFTDLLLLVIGGLLLLFMAVVIAPDGTYKDADGEARYSEIAPYFFGLFAAVQVWLLLTDQVLFDGTGVERVALSAVSVALALFLAFAKNMTAQKLGSVLAWAMGLTLVILQSRQAINGRLVRPEDIAPLQGAVVAIWLGAVALAVLVAIIFALLPIANRRTGFRPYGTHATWCVWFFAWMLLVWWRAPLLVDDGWQYPDLLFVSLGPLIVFIAWAFMAPQPTEGSAEAARSQYFDKAPQAFGALAVLAVWVIVMNTWYTGGAAAVSASVAWGIGLLLFLLLSRSSSPRIHAGVAILAWALLIAEYSLEIDRGLPTL
jgi:hypothetical protein